MRGRIGGLPGSPRLGPRPGPSGPRPSRGHHPLNLFDKLGYWLAVGLVCLVNVFDPQVIISGGLVSTSDYLYSPALTSFHKHVFADLQRTLPPIVSAQLGTEAGLVGAALLAMGRQFALAA